MIENGNVTDFSLCEDKSISWIGESFTGEDGKVHYKKCLVNDYEVSISQFVLINNSKGTGNISSAFIAEITDLFDSGDENGNNFHGHVKWYSRKSELGLVLRRQVANENELLMNKNGFDTEIDLETVLGLIEVEKLSLGQSSMMGYYFAGRVIDGRKVVSIEEEGDNEALSGPKSQGGLWMGEVSRSGRQIKRLVVLQESPEKVPKMSNSRRSIVRNKNEDVKDDDDEENIPKTPKSRRSMKITKNEEENSKSISKATNSRRSMKMTRDEDYIEEELENIELTPRKTLGSQKKKSEKSAKTPTKRSKAPHQAVTPGLTTRPATGERVPRSDDPLEIVRERLHQSVAPEALPCREQEFADIYQYVRDKIVDGCGGCMYVSGVPGTGKTATVKQVVSLLGEELSSGDLPKFKFVEVNGMRMTNPHQVNVQILLQLSGQKVTPDHACSLLERMFKTKDPKREPVVLLVDELDMLWTRKQTIMYNLFDWPSHANSKLVVVAIANTMDLPERMMMSRVASRLGLTRLTFQPYTHRQLEEIVISRLKGLEAFDEDAVQLVSRKVAAVSGDARRALEICRRATEFVDGGVVSTLHVDAAIQEMFSSKKIQFVRQGSEQEKFFLKALLAEFQRTGLEEAELEQVFVHHVSLCRFESIPPPTLTQVISICSKLSGFLLILSDPGSKDINQKIRLNIGQDDLMFALNHPA